MADLINRQVAIDYIKQQRARRFVACSIEEVMITILEELPSVQQEIIRCKDCKHYVIHTLFGHRQGWCERLCDEFDKSLARGTEEDDFCSRAERRTDD